MCLIQAKKFFLRCNFQIDKMTDIVPRPRPPDTASQSHKLLTKSKKYKYYIVGLNYNPLMIIFHQ